MSRLLPTPLKSSVTALLASTGGALVRRAISTLLLLATALQITAPALHAASDAPACGIAEIVGVVTGNDNDLPVEDVDVDAVGKTVAEDDETNVDGEYILALPIYRDRGPYTLSFDPPNGSPYLPMGPLNVQAISGTTTILNASLTLGAAIQGRVTAQDTGEPLRDVRVRASGVEILEDNDPMVRATTTDSDGQYRLQGLIGGDYVIYYDSHANPSSPTYTTTALYGEGFVGGGNYASEATLYPLTPGQTLELNITIPRGATLTGEVRRGDTALPATDVQVEIYLLDEKGSGRGDFGQATETDETGIYTFEGVASGDYLIFARPIHVGFGPESANIDLLPEWYENAASSEEAKAVTIPAEMNLAVSIEQEYSLDLTLEPGAIITGVVTDADTGEPVEGIGVDVRPRIGRQEVTHVVYPWRSDATGHYTITGLYEGNYGLIWDPGFGPYSAIGVNTFTGISVTVTAGGAKNVNFTVRKGGGIQGTLSDSKDEPVAGIEVSLISSVTGNVVRRTTSNAAGIYTFSNVTPGDYNIKYERFEPCGCFNDEYYGEDGTVEMGVVTIEAQETTDGINRQLACNAPPSNFVEMYMPRVLTTE